MFALGVTFGLLAVAIGTYRHWCSFWEQEDLNNVPLPWRSLTFQIVTWIIVAVLSVFFAGIISALVGGWPGRLLSGVWLVGRWQISGLLGYLWFKPQRDDFRAKFPKRQASETEKLVDDILKNRY